MRLLYIGIAILIVVILLSLSLIWVLAVKSQSPSRKKNARQPKLGFEQVSFRGSAQLYGWLIWPSGEVKQSSPAIIVSHGWGSNRSRVLRYADRLSEEGYAVLVYDVASHGESEGVKAPSALLFRDDLKAAVTYLKSREDIDADRIGILGHSLGGLGAVLALDDDLCVNAIVTDSMPSNPFMIVGAELKRRNLPLFPLAWFIPRIWLLRSHIPYADFVALDLAATLKRNAERGITKVPVLLSHSKGDNFIPPTELTNILERLPYEQQYVLVNTQGHSSSEQDESFWDAVLPFYRQYVPLNG